MKLLLGKHELAQQNLANNYNMKYLTTYSKRNTIRYDTRCYFNVRSKADISQLNLPQLVLPTFRSWTVHKIIEYLTLGLLFSL